MNFDGKQMQEEFNSAFGELYIDDREGSTMESFSIEDLTPQMLWWLVKFAKHVRLRCRNNSAFNNYMNRNFPNATFKEVTKYKKDGSTYQGLSIVVNGQELAEDSE